MPSHISLKNMQVSSAVNVSAFFCCHIFVRKAKLMGEGIPTTINSSQLLSLSVQIPQKIIRHLNWNMCRVSDETLSASLIVEFV